MSVSELIATFLSTDFMFGAASALAFRREVTALYRSVFGRAESAVEKEE